MGKFLNSLKREVGKNTGKAISNAIFGDKWATPYKRIEKREPSASAIARQQHNQIQMEKNELKRRELELRESELWHRKSMSQDRSSEEDAKNEALLIEKRAEAARNSKYQMWELDSAVIKNVDAVIALEVPSQEQELENLTIQLCNQMSTEHWNKIDFHGYKSQEGAIRDKYTKALLSKITFCVSRLGELYPNNSMLPYFNEQVYNFEKEQRSAQLWTKGDNNDLVANIAIPADERTIVLLLKELQSHYKYNWTKVIQRKFVEALSALEKINPDNDMISGFYKHHQKIVWENRLEKHKKAMIISGIVIVVLYIIGLMFIHLNKIPQQHAIGYCIHAVVYIIVLSVIAYPIVTWYKRKRRLDSYREARNCN